MELVVMGGGKRLRGERERHVKSETEEGEEKWGGKMKMKPDSDSCVLSSFFF